MTEAQHMLDRSCKADVLLPCLDGHKTQNMYMHKRTCDKTAVRILFHNNREHIFHLSNLSHLINNEQFN